jgi:hypothetical protein
MIIPFAAGVLVAPGSRVAFQLAHHEDLFPGAVIIGKVEGATVWSAPSLRARVIPAEGLYDEGVRLGITQLENEQSKKYQEKSLHNIMYRLRKKYFIDRKEHEEAR